MNEVMFENVKFTVLAVENRRIEKVRVEILPAEDKDLEKDDSKSEKDKKSDK